VAPATPSTDQPPAPRRSRWARLCDYRLLLLLAGLIFALDRLSKAWIAAHLPFPTYGGPATIPVIPGFFNLVHVGNTGAAWSMFSGAGVFLAALAAATLLAIFVWRHSLGLRDRTAQISFGLLCGGIAGNLTDRLLHGHVIDFIDLHFGSYIYPTFNIADSGICVGVVLYLWQSLRAPNS
jgi:signal peptidase II